MKLSSFDSGMSSLAYSKLEATLHFTLQVAVLCTLHDSEYD